MTRTSRSSQSRARDAHPLVAAATVGVVLLCVALLCCNVGAQSLDQLLDDEAFLKGLQELRLPEVLRHYIENHPPADDVRAAQYKIAAERLTLAESGTSTDDRIAAAERLAAIQRGLIAEHPKDSRRAIWMADLAADLFFEVLPADGSGLTAVFGIPTPNQRTRAGGAAREILTLADHAESALSQLLLDLESTPGFAENLALQQRRRELIDRERDRRIPFLRAVGLALDAELNVADEAQRRAQYDAAVQSLAALADTLEGQPAIQARLFAGLAKARMGLFEDAEAMFSAVANDSTSPAADGFAARMGSVVNRTRRGGAKAGLEALESIKTRYVGRENVFFRLIIADQEFLLHNRLAREGAAAQREQEIVKAVASYTGLIDSDLGLPKDTTRSIVFSRLSNAAALLPQDVSIDRLPATVAVARADQLVREPGTREQGIIELEKIITSGLLKEPDHAAALFALGKALFEQDHLLFAAQRFIELADKYPAQGQAESAIELGVTIAADLHARDAADEESRQALRNGLRVLLSKYPNLDSIDRWRYVAGRFALEENRFDDAVAFFSQIAPDAVERLDALYMQAVTATGKARSAAEAGQGLKANDEAIAVIDRVEPLLKSGLQRESDAKRAASLRYYASSLRTLRGEAMLRGHRPNEALEAVADIERQPGIEADVIGEALKVRIGAYQELKRMDDAMKDIDQFIKTSPDQVAGVLGPTLAALQRDVQALVNDSRDDQSVELAQRTLLPIAKLLGQWLDTGSADDSTVQKLGLQVADAFRLGGQCEEALRWYDRLLTQRPDAVELLLGRAECCFQLGGEQRLGESMTLYKRLAAAGPASDKDTYWLAQLRMLQILDQADKHTEQILPKIERLRQQDSQFGGERFRRGFEALRNKYAAR